MLIRESLSTRNEPRSRFAKVE